MSGITEEFGRITEASESPTLGLLRLKWAPFVLAVFRQVFDQASTTITTDRLHVRVGVYLEEMAAAGHEVPTGDGRALCTQWMHNRWLNRIHDDDGNEAYELTSAALGAQRVVENLARDRALLSESRLVTIIDGVRRLAVDANPDRDSRIATLDAQIRALQAERDYLQEGGHIEPAPDDRMLEGYLDMRDLLGQLPRDFRRVEETLDVMRRDLVKEFRADERPKGDVLEEYLERSERLSTQTEEGRAFEGALAILSDVPLLREFQDGLARILDHPFAGSLRPEEADEFRRSANLLRRGLRDVQTTRTRLHRSLSDFITSHDSASEREVTRTLNALQEEMAVWMESARIRDGVPMPGDMPEKLQFEHLKTRFWDPADHRQVADLEDVTDTTPEALGLDEVRRQGGPLLTEIRAAVARAASAGAQTLGDAFSTLPDDLRRPVELFGLMHLTADAVRDETVEAVITRRPDGTTRTLLIPRVPAHALIGHAQVDDAAPAGATPGVPTEEDPA